MANSTEGLNEVQKKEVQQMILNYRPTFLMRMEKFYAFTGKHWGRFKKIITTKKEK
jgi:hypothetical protein